jgi:putative FmdB family regulatory protein
MPLYEFECKSCNKPYDEIARYDETGMYKDVECPHCGSKEKDKLISACNYAFTNPVGTDKWNSESTGHDYRFKHNIPKVKKEREMAEVMSQMGTSPYGAGDGDIEKFGEGVHDPETRKGLS